MAKVVSGQWSVVSGRLIAKPQAVFMSPRLLVSQSPGLPFVALLTLLALCVGCGESKTASESKTAAEAVATEQYQEEMVLKAVDNLDRLEEYDSPDTFQRIVYRLNQLGGQIQKRTANQKQAGSAPDLVEAWVEPEMLRQIDEQINEWLHSHGLPDDWKLDPMAAALPKQFAELPEVAGLDRQEFSGFDGFVLREIHWLRAVATWTRGDVADDLARAQNIFDWTVRNIQLEPDYPGRVPQFPWETLLFGRGTAVERTWVYILLLRQLDIDAAVLALETRDGGRGTGDGRKAPPKLRPWCVGVLIEGNVYLFDPMLGLPILAPDGVTLDKTGQLSIRPATLAQVVANDKLLRRLDVSDANRYEVKAADLARVTALLEASPSYLSRRMKLLESQMAGKQKMTLTTSPSMHAKRWKSAAHIADAQLWLSPYETLVRRSHLNVAETAIRLQAMLPFYMPSEEQVLTQENASSPESPTELRKSKEMRSVTYAAPLFRGRVLHLKGQLVGEDGAPRFYQIARPANQALTISSMPNEYKAVKLLGKYMASYWSGQVAYESGNFPTAIDFFRTRTLEAFPGRALTPGARYNLARSYEASDDWNQAELLYGITGYSGDLLRAKWLEEAAKKRPTRRPGD
jgi:hypothetical protein